MPRKPFTRRHAATMRALLYVLTIIVLWADHLYAAASVSVATANSFDPWVSLVTNVGLPIALIVIVYRDFVRPLGGANGVVARYFQTQAEHSAKQTELITEQRDLTSKLVSSISVVQTNQINHVQESHRFYAQAAVDFVDLIRIHRLIASAIRREFKDIGARDDLVEIDRICDKYLSRDANDDD